jgi:hypothetical protein
MQNKEYQKLIEASWRRPLTAVERARWRELLAAHPQAQESWEEEAALNGLLRRLPSAALSTNFTARVLQEARRLPPRPGWRLRLGMFPWLPAGWVPRAALAAAMVCTAMLSFHEYQAVRRAREAQALASASRLAALPPIEWLVNFDTINGLDKRKVADDDLLAVLQ